MFALVSLAFAPPALAAAFFFGHTPTPGGSASTLTPQIVVAADESFPINVVDANMTIDGVPQAVAIYYPFDDPPGSTGDHSRAIISADYAGPPLTWGVPATVVVNVQNDLLEWSQTTWQFTPNQPPMVVSVTPLESSVSTATSRRPVISATLTDPDSSISGFSGVLDGASNFFIVDGIPVSNLFVTKSEVGATKTFRYTPSPLSDHTTHTVEFGATDGGSVWATKTWQFRIDTTWAGSFSHLSPTGSPVTSATAPISIRVRADDARYAIDPNNPNNSMSLDGSQITTATFSNPVPGDPTVLEATGNRLLSDGAHTVVTSVRDIQGLDAIDTWNFSVASPPMADTFTPAVSTANLRPTISAHIEDNGPGSTTVTMTLDGVPVVSGVTNPVPWTVSYTPGGDLSDSATHTVGLEMRDASGNTSSAGWDFRVESAGGVTFSSMTPASASTTSNPKPRVSVVATSSVNLDASKTKLYYDSTQVAPVVTPVGSKRLNISGVDGTLSDGSHSIRVEVTDDFSLTSSATWSFDVQAPPVLTAPIPGVSAVTGAARPPIGFWIADNGPGIVHVALELDSGVIFESDVAQGAFWWNPASDLSLGSHTVHAEVTDAANNTRVLDWSFTVSDRGPMSDSRDCVNCHMGRPTPNHAQPTGGAPCTSCHTDPDQWTSPPDSWHDDAAVTSAHSTSTTGCTDCHDASLITLHGNYPTGSGLRFQCATCHDSKDSAVQAAISAKNTACSACHDIFAAGEVHEALHGSGFLPGATCAGCHKPNIAAQHDDDCATCHQSPDPAVANAIATHNSSCTACHTGHHAESGGINHSGQQRLGAWNPSGEVGDVPGHSPVPGAGTFTYLDWKPTLAGNVGDNSPHGNYTTTTVKCVVCHAVHYAAPGGAPVGSGQTADTLLRMRAEQACIFCHATTGFAVNGYPVYNGAGGTITAPSATGGNATTGHIIGTNCSMCHTNVHGANADHSVASLDGYLLKLIPQSAVTSMNVETANMIEAITAIDHQAENQGFAAGTALGATIGDYASTNTPVLREQAVGVFCAQCHDGAYATGAAGASTNVLGSGSVAYSGHRIAASATADWNVDGSKSSGTSTGTVAWAAAANCKSCHDAKDDFGRTAFPHSWGGTKMWLVSAAEASAVTTEALSYGPGSDAINDQLSDGVCLKCHVAPGGASGIGLTF